MFPTFHHMMPDRTERLSRTSGRRSPIKGRRPSSVSSAAAGLLRATTFALPRPDLFGDEAAEIGARARLHSDLGFTPDDLPLYVHQGAVSVNTAAPTNLQRKAIECVVEGVPSATSTEALPGIT